MDVGRDYAHHTLIYPFADRPDVGVPVLFYPVALDSPNVPPSPFVLRNWDRLERLDQTILGTDQEQKTYYYGPLPNNPPGTPCGTPDQWEHGISYARWIAGGYSCDCPEDTLPAYVSSVRCDDGSLIVSPATNAVEVHVDTTHSFQWTAEHDFGALVKIDTSGLPGYMGLEYVGNKGAGPSDVLQVFTEGQVNIAGNLNVNSSHAAQPVSVDVGFRGGWQGLKIRPVTPGPPNKPYLTCESSGPTIHFAINFDGGIWTDQTYAATTLGNVVAAMPIYDGSGTLVGYLPIYDSIT